MRESRDLSGLIRWGDGAAVAVLVLAALWGLPILMLLLPRCGLSRLSAPCVTVFLVLLALLLDVRAQRQALAMRTPISPDVVDAAQKRFQASPQEERYTSPRKRKAGRAGWMKTVAEEGGRHR
jgi:hypothetical protein